MTIRRIYLDNSSTTPVAPEVVAAMLPFLTEHFGNASSVHGFGQRARAAVEDARRQVADLIGAAPPSITFLSGGTEANNLAIRGVMDACAKPGAHIITSSFEHPAVLAPVAALEAEGFRVTRLPVYEDGRVRIEDFENTMTDDTVLVTVMLANNEVGTLQPIAEIGQRVRAARERGQTIFLHTDAVQAVGKIPVSVDELGVDLLSISGHKLHAPKGIGALYVRKDVRLAPQQLGGHQERDRRAGTENVSGIVALGRAAALARAELPDVMPRLRELRDRLEDQLAERIPGCTVNGLRDQRLPHVSNLHFGPLDGDSLVIALDLQGIAVSTGSACSSGSTEPSAVLTAMGFSREHVKGSLRLSLGRDTTAEDIAYVADVLPRLVEKRLKK